MRLVCTEWQKNVEQGVGLKVKVDDSILGNLEFVKRVKAKKARILNWTVEIGTEPGSPLFQHPDWLKKLKLCGKMPAKWKIHDLSQFPNLAHLVLRDRVLHSNNLTGHPLPDPKFDLTSDLPLEKQLTNAFQTEDPPTEAQPIQLKSLQKLEIIRYDNVGYREDTRLETQGYLVMMVNVCFILRHVTSPLLTVAHLTVGLPRHLTVGLPRHLRAALNKLNWTLGPLHIFLNNHRLSLRQLLLPSFHGQASHLFEQACLSNSFPINLKKLMLHLDGITGFDSREEKAQSNFVYLQNCLQRQTQLQEVYFDFYVFPSKWVLDALTSLANSCGRTLRYLELQRGPGYDEGAFDFDLQMLSVCHSLEVLHMSIWADIMVTFKNVEKLPVSLKRLVICCNGNGGQLDIGDPNVFKTLTALEWLYLDSIRLQTASNGGTQEPQRQFCRIMIKGLLGLRKLEGFQLKVHEVALNSDPSIVNMLRPLDPSINPAVRYAQSETNYNLNWRYYQRYTNNPWSDKPFDIYSWDMEKLVDEDLEPRQEAVVGFGPVRPPIAMSNGAGEIVDDGDDDEIENVQEDDIADDQDEDMEFDLDEEDDGL